MRIAFSAIVERSNGLVGAGEFVVLILLSERIHHMLVPSGCFALGNSGLHFDTALDLRLNILVPLGATSNGFQFHCSLLHLLH